MVRARVARWWRLGAVILGLAVWDTVGPALAQDADYAVPGGHVYTQAAGDAPPGAGYLVSDADGIPFWTRFQELGGPHVVGYPVSQRFEWLGFTVQVMQKLVFQWHPATSEVMFINIFDELHRAGLDDELARLLVPRHQTFPEEQGLSWNEVIGRRWGFMDASPPIRDAYFGPDDPLRWFGLPTSEIVHYDGMSAIRAQRAVIQLWHIDTPWARAGEVTIANGGDLAKQLGLFPESVLQTRREGSAEPTPMATPAPTATPTPTATPAPTASPTPTASPAPTVSVSGDAVVDRMNEVRADLGLPPLTAHPALMQAAQAHADYYVINRNDPNSGGLHTEVAGKPGFTGRTIGDRADAAGYPLGWVDETFGFLPPARTLEWALITVFHRYMFVHPSAVHVGYGWASAEGTRAAVFNVGLSPRHTADVPLPSVMPRSAAVGVPHTWDGAEWPDPAPGVPRPVGPPITLIFGLGDRVAWGDATVTPDGGAPVAVTRSISEWRRALALIPNDPLAPNTLYHVRVTGQRNGEPFVVATHFTTTS